MTALLAAPWPFLVAFCLFGGVLICCALWWLLCWAVDNWPGDLNDPNDFGADETRIPKE